MTQYAILGGGRLARHMRHYLSLLDHYRNIPFMVDSGRDFATLLPGLPNPHYPIPPEHKARYHALCVMAGNFSQLLWQGVARRFTDLGLPAGTLEPYLRQVLENFLQDPATALTGPLSRGDWQTIDRNLGALGGDSLEPLYRAFLEHWRAEQGTSQMREVRT